MASVFDWYIPKEKSASLSSSQRFVKCLQAIRNDDGEELKELLKSKDFDCDEKFKRQGMSISLIEDACRMKASDCGEYSYFIYLIIKIKTLNVFLTLICLFSTV